MKKFINSAPLVLAFALFLGSCSSDRLKEVDTDAIELAPIKVLRLDRDVFATPPDSFATGSKRMLSKYKNFYNTFIFSVVNRGEQRDPVYKALALFVTDPDMKQVNKTVQEIYQDAEMQRLENELTQSFKYFKYHFPKCEIPEQYVSFISGFNYNITSMDSTLGISLDMYLGEQNKYYQMLQWPRYKTRCMNKENVTTDAMRGWIIHCFDKNEPVNNLLNHMIFYGKIYYALDAVLPFTPDSIKIGYSTKQMEYCAQYKKNLWAYFTEQDRLFKNDLKEMAAYVSEGPFTSAISKECPPRIAMYVGWQIVRAYMNKNTDVTLQQLMGEKDAQKILTKSKYKP